MASGTHGRFAPIAHPGLVHFLLFIPFLFDIPDIPDSPDILIFS
jgi:hypothetical protein